jgi:NAD(P)-dependent dehydrogenase (short-subunit alcohol dehydrogenase family)
MNTSPKKVLITGSNRGIGYETARKLKELGLFVILSARDSQKGQTAATELGVEFLEMDVSNEPSITSATTEYKQRFGSSLDILINNAGIFPDKEQSILNLQPDLINQALLTNTIGPMLVTQNFLPLLENNKDGARIINLSSKLGQLSSMSDTAPAYSISKTALNALTRQQSAALADKNISVTAVSPGWVRTDMGGENADLSVQQGADSIVWLATEAPQSLTGQFIRDRKQIEW